jgi:propanol-preferring alcohol dehydrogenase
MHAMVLPASSARLTPLKRSDPIPSPGKVRTNVNGCGVCRTDLHVVDGEPPNIPYPVFPSHEIGGLVEALAHLREGKLVGAAVLRP